jgi:hypothetical protein
MDNLGESNGGRTLLAQKSASPLFRLRRHWDLLAVILLMLGALPTFWLSPRTLNASPTEINLIDDSWILDTAFKASRGLWLGRDVAFTYGPLFQWLWSAPSRLMGISMGAIYDSCVTLPLWCTYLFGYLTLVLLLPEQPAWKRFVLLLLLGMFWATVEGRIAFAVVLFAVFLRGWYAVQERTLNPVLLGCCAALLCAAAFLYSADTGVYALAGLALSFAGAAWDGRGKSHMVSAYTSTLFAFVVASLVLVIAINAFMAKPFDFRLWKNALAIFSGYRWIEPASMSKPGKIRLLAVLIISGIVFSVRGLSSRRGDFSITARPGFLLSAFGLCFLTMQSGLVRSDVGHIIVASYATVFLTGVVLFSFPFRVASAGAVLLAVACSLMFGGQPSLLSALRYNYEQVRHPSTTCPSRFVEFDRVCYPDEFAKTLQTTAAFLQQHSGPRDFMAVFPFQNIFGIASRRNVAGGVLQSYLVSGPYLSQVDIAGLERAAAPVGLYLPDGNLSTPVDGIPNFTRSPEVWLWMFRHYRGEQELVPGIFGLQRDDSRVESIAMQVQPLNIAGRYAIPRRHAILQLGGVTWPVGGADFLRLRLTVRYSLWWKIRKPARLVLEIERADSSDDLKPFIVQPNVPSEIWFYPWDDTDLAHYFSAEETRWRTGSRPPIVRLRLLVMPLDWVSVKPDVIEVQSVDAIRFGIAR